MDFGMPTLIELGTLPETVELCTELGLTFIELNMNMPQYQIEALSGDTLYNTQNNDIYFTIHLEENLNIWDFNPLVAKAYLDTVLSAIDFAKGNKIPILNMHMNTGVYFTLPNERVYLYDRYRRDFMEKTRRFRQECESAIGESDIKICIENSDGFTDFQMEAMEYLLESPLFGLTLDIGHDHSIGNKDEPYFMCHKNKLYHMHIHDAIADKNHLAIGSGEIDIHQKLLLAETHNCRCVLETKTVEGLKLSVSNLHNLFKGITY